MLLRNCLHKQLSGQVFVRHDIACICYAFPSFCGLGVIFHSYACLTGGTNRKVSHRKIDELHTTFFFKDAQQALTFLICEIDRTQKCAVRCVFKKCCHRNCTFAKCSISSISKHGCSKWHALSISAFLQGSWLKAQGSIEYKYLFFWKSSACLQNTKWNRKSMPPKYHIHASSMLII